MSAERMLSSITIGATAMMMLIVRRLQTGQLITVNEFICMNDTVSTIDRENIIHEKAINSTIHALNQMKQICVNEGVEHTVVKATSSILHAKNAEAFRLACQERSEFDQIEILQTEQEARLSFLGANASREKGEKLVLIDLGGGSTEIIFGVGEEKVYTANMKMGYIDLTKKCRLNRFLSFLAKRKAHRMVNDQIKHMAEGALWVTENKPTFLVSGAICASFIGLATHKTVMRREDVHGAISTLKQLELNYNQLMKMPARERINAKGIERDRAAMVPGALLILSSIMRYFKVENYEVTADGLRLGILLDFTRDYEVSHD